MWKAILLFLALVALSNSLPRDAKAFSLFNVVQFENEVCQSTSEIPGATSMNRNGTCFTSTECSDKNGMAEGSCASGFGVCCVFLVESGTIMYNNTYARNANFPMALTETATVNYQIEKAMDDVCYVRLDFETFNILGTGNTFETNGGACVDTFTATVMTNNPIPVICGSNTGQHMFLDIGRGESDTASMAFAFMGASTARVWEIRVSQYTCSDPMAPPNGCLQYHMGLTGMITTFNFAPAANENHLANQMYSICMRQEMGYCCIRYQQCAGVTSAFTLDTKTMTAATDSLCTLDFVGIEASNHVCRQGDHNQVRTKYCGQVLSFFTGGTATAPVCDCTAPFVVEISTDTAKDIPAANTARSRGVCLQFDQVLCGSS